MIADHDVVREWTPRRGKLRVIACGDGKAISVVSLGSGFGVSVLTEQGYDTAIIVNGEVSERVPGYAIVCCSQDQRSWLVLKRDPTADGAAVESRFANARQTTIEVWDAAHRCLRASLAGFPVEGPGYGGLRAAGFSRDSRLLVVNDGLRRATIRDGRTGEIFDTIRHYEGDRLITFALSPDGRYLLTMGCPTMRGDNGIVLWELTYRSNGKQ